MSYHNNTFAGFSSSSKKGSNTRTYVNAEGDLVEEGNGEFLGARLAGGEAFVSDSEEDSAGSGHYTTSNSKKEKKKSKKSKDHQFDPAMHASSAVQGQREYSLGYEASSSGKKKKSSKHRETAQTGGCCSGCHSHAQQPAQQAHHGMMNQPPQGNGYAGYPASGAAQGYGRSYH